MKIITERKRIMQSTGAIYTVTNQGITDFSVKGLLK